jgi:flagellar assembly protein FliH
MSSRVATREEAARARPFLWPEIASTASCHLRGGDESLQGGDCDPESMRAAEEAMHAALEEAAALRARVEELESLAQVRAEDGFRKGVAAGESKERERAAAEQTSALDRMGQAIGEIAGLRHRLRQEAESDLVRLAIAIARRVLHREVSVDPDALEGVVSVALDKLRSAEILRVRTHPLHAASISAQLERRGLKISVEAVATLEPGSVDLETARGSLDGSMTAQLMEVERGIAARLRQ